MVMPIRALRLQADIIAAGFDITGAGTVFATPRIDSFSDTGFIVDLSANTDNTNYIT